MPKSNASNLQAHSSQICDPPKTLLRSTTKAQPWDRLLLGQVSGKQRWALRQTTYNTPKRLRDCKTQLIDNAPLGFDSGYKDLCAECNLDQWTYKTMSGWFILQTSQSVVQASEQSHKNAIQSAIFHSCHKLNRQPFFHMHIYFRNHKFLAQYLWWDEDLVQYHHVACGTPFVTTIVSPTFHLYCTLPWSC
jgi:hypothetical protein